MPGFVLSVIFIFIFIAPVYADVYRYTDENGVMNYTDSPFDNTSERIIEERQEQTVESIIAAKPGYNKYIKKAALKYNIEPELIRAVIKTESNGDHMAVSGKGAVGLMQLMPATADDMNVGNPYSPEENIDGGTKYLRYLLKKFNGNLTLALAAYNAGPKTVEKYGKIPPISETKQYIKKIYSIYQGKRKFDTSDSNTPGMQRNATIYKVILEDGTILFTNSTLEMAGKIRF